MHVFFVGGFTTADSMSVFECTIFDCRSCDLSFASFFLSLESGDVSYFVVNEVGFSSVSVGVTLFV